MSVSSTVVQCAFSQSPADSKEDEVTALKILKVPHGPFPSLYSSTRRPPNANSSYANVARSSSIADRRSRSRGPRNNTTTTSSSIGSGSGSASSGSGFIGIGRRDPSVDTSLNERHEEEAEREGGVDEEPLSVEELMDVRHGSRLSPSYLFQDVRWGYGATSNKLATACTNGAVILWDLNRDSGNSKLGKNNSFSSPLVFVFSTDHSAALFETQIK